MTTFQVGETRICKWIDNKVAAFSVGGDDSLRSQLYFAIPEMDKRGIRGTWWVNPGRGGSSNLTNQDDAWANCWIACYDDWKAAAARGHDFANHTMHHLGATSYAQAEEEISQTAQAIWNSNPGQRLQLFLRGGGTEDPRLYDYPLTLATRIPADWGNATVVSNKAVLPSTTAQDTVQFDAAPGREEILITKD